MANKRVKPSKANTLRMYLRSPKTKYLIIAAKTVDDAIRLPAVKLKSKVKVRAALSAKTEIVAMPAGFVRPVQAARPAKTAEKNIEVVKPPFQPRLTTAAGKSGPKTMKNSKGPPPQISKATHDQTSKPSKSSNILPYEGQPRFEGGIRFFQGGLPELGKRR